MPVLRASSMLQPSGIRYLGAYVADPSRVSAESMYEHYCNAPTARSQNALTVLLLYSVHHQCNAGVVRARPCRSVVWLAAAAAAVAVRHDAKQPLARPHRCRHGTYTVVVLAGVLIFFIKCEERRGKIEGTHFCCRVFEKHG